MEGALQTWHENTRQVNRSNAVCRWARQNSNLCDATRQDWDKNKPMCLQPLTADCSFLWPSDCQLNKHDLYLVSTESSSWTFHYNNPVKSFDNSSVESEKKNRRTRSPTWQLWIICIWMICFCVKCFKRCDFNKETDEQINKQTKKNSHNHWGTTTWRSVAVLRGLRSPVCVVRRMCCACWCVSLSCWKTPRNPYNPEMITSVYPTESTSCFFSYISSWQLKQFWSCWFNPSIVRGETAKHSDMLLCSFFFFWVPLCSHLL